MATASAVTHAHIVKRPDYCGGKAAIDNTRVRVNNVAFLHKEGKSPDEIKTIYPDLSPAQIHAALAYYYDHRDAIESELTEDEGWEEDHERRKAEYLARHPAK